MFRRPDLLWKTFVGRRLTIISSRIESLLNSNWTDFWKFCRKWNEFSLRLYWMWYWSRFDLINWIQFTIGKDDPRSSFEVEIIIFFFLKWIESGSNWTWVCWRRNWNWDFSFGKVRRIGSLNDEKRIFEVIESGGNSKEFCNFFIYGFVLIVTSWKFRGKIYRFWEVNRIFIHWRRSIRQL